MFISKQNYFFYSSVRQSVLITSKTLFDGENIMMLLKIITEPYWLVRVEAIWKTKYGRRAD